MHAAATVRAFQDDQLIFVQQLGIGHVFAAVQDWDADTLAAVRNRVEKTGLHLEGIENLPLSLYARSIVGLPGREAQIERVCQVVQSAGTAGIPLLTYRWTPPEARPPEPIPQGRGGALIRKCDSTPSQREPVRIAAGAMWDNLGYFLEQVLPVAREAGVRLAVHPDDPPVASLAGVACILNHADGLRQFLELSSDPGHGLDLCLGTLASMPGVDPVAVAGKLAGSGRVFAVHLRNTRGEAPRFSNVFLDEGDLPVPRVLQALRAAGYDGPVRPAQPPGLVEDTPWGHKGRAFDLGYLKAILQMLGP
jgi:mannonate dehydratase